MLLVFVLSSDTSIKEVMVEGVSSIIPNNTYLDDGKFFALITKPNMGGKICLMAHMGCYVLADYAKIPLLDRVKVLNLNTNQEMEYMIVEVKVPAGVVKYKILEIRR